MKGLVIPVAGPVREFDDDLDTGGHQDLSDEVAELVRALPGAGEAVS